METKKTGKNTWFRVVVVILMAIIIALLCYQKFGRKAEPANALEASLKAKLGQLDGKSESEIQEELNRVIEEGMFHISINTTPVFANGEAEGNLEIENVPNNHYSMVVQIALQDTGEQIYDSGLIEPNYHIQKDVLEKDLDAGEYAAVATFHAYDMETQEEIGSTACEMMIYVLE
jgi:hypothetical protein